MPPDQMYPVHIDDAFCMAKVLLARPSGQGGSANGIARASARREASPPRSRAHLARPRRPGAFGVSHGVGCGQRAV